MKPCRLVAALLLLVSGFVEAVIVRARHGSSANATSHSFSESSSISTVRRFGPKHCVVLERSQKGSCIIRTDCHGQDTSALEFALDCWTADGDIFRHSYGKGGFAEQEEFDTGVQCAQCHPPSAEVSKKAPASVTQTSEVQHPLAQVPMTPSGRVAATIAATENKHEVKYTVQAVAGGLGDLASTTVSRYGPKQCVSTWRNTQGHCMLQTACQDVDISSYEVGLICVDEKGAKMRHVFGRGSFDNSETFDTLAECSECMGLDDQRIVALGIQKKRWAESAEVSEVATLSEEVKVLTKGMSGMLNAVLKLREKVADEKKPTPAPSVVATLNAWSGQDTLAVNRLEQKVGQLAAKVQMESSHPSRLRTAAAADSQVAAVRVVRDVKKKHHHHRRRVEEDDDDDDDDYDDDTDEHDKDGEEQSDEEENTNGIGQVLSAASDAENSELEVAEDGEASAGSLDDGSMSLAPAW